MFKRAIPKCTPEEQSRQDKCREMGCIACRMDKDTPEQCGRSTIHHLTISGRTISQLATICLGDWHHLGSVPLGETTSSMTFKYGPSLAKGSKTFHAHYGSNESLLKYQDELIA